MKAGNGHHFEQSYNAQAAVEVESRLIVGERVSQAPNDKQELVPTAGGDPRRGGNRGRGAGGQRLFQRSGGGASGTNAPGAGPVVYAAVEKPGITGAWPIWRKRPNPTARRRSQPDRSDAAPAENHGGQDALQTAAANGRTRLWDHQSGAGVPAISVARTGESGAGMDAGLPGLQPETAASAGRGPETGGHGLKRQEGSRKNRLGPVTSVVKHRNITDWVRHRGAGTHCQRRLASYHHNLAHHLDPSPTGC